MVFDNELSKECYAKPKGEEIVFTEMINWLMDKIQELIESRKNQLPIKVVKRDYPKVLWV